MYIHIHTSIILIAVRIKTMRQEMKIIYIAYSNIFEGSNEMCVLIPVSGRIQTNYIAIEYGE